MKKPALGRAVGLLVIVNITGEREYSYKVPGFPYGTGRVRAKEYPPTVWPGGFVDKNMELVRD